MSTITTISSGQTSSGLTITSGNSLIVLSGGTAVTTTIASGGTETLSSGGTTSGTVISLGGLVSGHGLLAGSTTDAGKLSGGTVIGGGVLSVTSGGLASSVIVVSGGTVDVLNGGSAVTTTISSTGSQVVLSGGRTVSALVSSGGSEVLSFGGVATSATLASGGYQTVASGGISVSATVKSAGTETIAAGGTAVGASVQLGGTLSALGVLLGTVTNAGVVISGTVGSGATTINTAGAKTSGLIVGSGGTEILSGGSAIATVVQSGGTLVFAGGVATGLLASAGATEVVLSGATASGATAGAGVLLLVSGTASHAIIGSGGTESVVASGYASGTTVSSGGIEIVQSGGVASGTAVASGGTEIISSGGVLEYNGGSATFSGTLQGGGTLDLSATSFTYAGPAGSSNVGVVQQGGTLTLKASETFGGGYAFSGGSASIASGTTLTIGGTSDLDDAYIAGPGKLDTTGVTSVGFYLDGGLTWINGGTVSVSAYVYESYPSGSGSIVISNTTTGVFDLLSGSYLYDYNGGADTFINAGTLAEIGSATANISAFVSNTGTISVGSGGSLVFDGGGSFGGTISGAGTVVFAGGTATLLSGLSLSASFEDTGAIISLTSNTALANATIGGTIDLDSTTLTLTGSASLGGAEIIGPGQLDTTGTTTFNSLLLDGGLTWVNSGTVSASSYLYESYPSGSGSIVISNTASGVFDLVSGAYIYSPYGNAETFINAGTLAQTSSGTDNVQAFVSNTGAIAIASGGSLAFDDGGSFGGTISGAGTVVFAGGTATLLSGLSLSASFEDTGAIISLTSNTALANATIGGTIDLDSTTLTLTGSASLGGAEIIGPGQLDTTGTTTFNSLLLDGGLTWVNSGTVLASNVLYESYPSGSGSIVISNTASGVFDLVSGSQIYNYGTSETFINAGTLIQSGSGTAYVGAFVSNTGSLSATGTLALTAGGTLAGTLGATNTKGSVLLDAGTFTTAAGTAATVADDGTAVGLSLASGETWTNAGTILNAGHLHVGNVSGGSLATLAITSGGALTLTGADSAIGSLGSATITNAGTISQNGPTGTDTITVGIANTGLIDAATGTLALTGGVFGSGSLQIETGGSLELGTTLSTTQTVTYNGSGGTLILEKPASIKLLKTFGIGDKIDLAGVTATAAGLSGDVLTVSTSGTTYTFTSNESLASDHAQYTSDGHGGSIVTLYAGAQAAAHVPEPVVFANVHVGGTITQGLTITNTAPAGPYTETLDASLGSATTGFTATGTVTGIAGGASNSTALTITESTANAGTLSGTSVLTLESDGTGIDNSGITPLPSQTVTMNGAVYAYAAPSLSATTVSLGAARVGGVLTTGSLTVSNGTTASAYQESLLYGATGPAAVTITNASGTISAGGTSTLGVSIGTGTAGDFTGTPVTVGLTSTGAGTSGLGNTTLTSDGVTVNAQVFAPAVAQLGTTTVSVGIIHVGDTVAAGVGVTNAGTGALVDLLTAGTATDTGEVSGVSYAGLGSGVTAGNSGTISLSLNTATAGTISGSSVIGFDSHDAALADLAIAGGTVAVTGTIDNYAVATVEDTGGAGTFSGSGSAYVLNLGTVSQGAAAITADLGVINAAVGPADLLGGSFAASGSAAFTNSGTAAFSGLAAGQADTSPEVTLNTGTAGVFTETLVVSPTGSNASGYSGALAAETISVTGTVVSNGTTYTLTGAPTTIAGTTGNDTIDAASNTLNSHDTISGAGGVNTLNLEGAGYFDLGAPATLTDIQIVTAQESSAGTTVYMRNALTVTLNVTPGGSGSLLIYGGTGSNTYNLGAGSDTVVAGAKTETVNAGGGTALVQATTSLAGVLVNGGTVGSAGTTTLEITNGGTAILNGADTNLFVKLDSATVLSLGSGAFITAVGPSTGHYTITAGGTSQTLETLGGTDTLVGAASDGDTFLGASAGFAGDTIKTFGGSDTIDITDMLYTSLKPLTYSGNATSGKLGVSDGTHNVTLTMAGSYTVSSFVPSSDGHNGTLISFV